jgi:hypothetical protein
LIRPFQDLTNLYDQYESIEPWLQRKDGLEKDGKEHFQSVEDRKKLVRYYRKINWTEIWRFSQFDDPTRGILLLLVYHDLFNLMHVYKGSARNLVRIERLVKDQRL